MDIDWNAFVLVFGASLGFSVAIVLTFALGVRLYTNAEVQRRLSKKGNQSAAVAELWNRTISYALFAVSSSALLYGIYLIVPYFRIDQ